MDRVEPRVRRAGQLDHPGGDGVVDPVRRPAAAVGVDERPRAVVPELVKQAPHLAG